MKHPMEPQKPTEIQGMAMDALRPILRTAYDTIKAILPDCRERSLALTKLAGLTADTEETAE